MKKGFYAILLLLAVILYAIKHTGGYVPVWVNVLNDIIALPLLLFLMEKSMRFLYGRQFTLSPLWIFGTWAFISVLFELVFPAISARSTADAWDVVWYAVGAGGYLLVEKEATVLNQKSGKLQKGHRESLKRNSM